MDAQLAGLARASASALFLAAAGFRLARWRLLRDPAGARGAVALILLGAAMPILAGTVALLRDGVGSAAPMPASRLVLMTAVFGVLLVGRARPAVVVGIGPVRLAIVLILACAVATGLLAGLASHVNPWFWAGAEGVLALGWLGRARAAQRSPRPTAPWLAWSLVLLAVSETLLAGNDVHRGLAASAAAGLQVCAAVVVATASGADLWQAFVMTDAQTEALTGVLDDTRRRLHHVEQIQQERLHDARSVVLGVLGASSLLARSGRRENADRLHQLMTAELHRLSGVLDPGEPEPIGDFTVASAVEPVLAVHQLGGVQVHCEVSDLVVQGRIRDTATVFANLLANCRTHAPAAAVWITARQVADTVVICVEDDGPGLADGDRDRVLARGARGTGVTSDGHGLGLYTARAAMLAQSGELWLGRGSRGGTRVVLTLPVAHPARHPRAIDPSVGSQLA